jgi:hypothetical protein
MACPRMRRQAPGQRTGSVPTSTERSASLLCRRGGPRSSRRYHSVGCPTPNNPVAGTAKLLDPFSREACPATFVQRFLLSAVLGVVNRLSRLVLVSGALAGCGLACLALVSRGSGSRGPAVASCTAAGLARTAGLAAATFTLARCDDGWALAVGLNGAAAHIGIFQLEDGQWADDPGFGPAPLSAVSPLQFATAGISPSVLLRLAAPFPQWVRQITGAGALVEELAAREARLGAPGSYRVSQVLRAGDATWLVLAGANSAPLDDPDSTVQVYRWSAAGWSDQGTVTGAMGPISPGCCGISAGFQTGSPDPDFTMIGGGAADTNWLSVITDASGHWRLAPFDYGYTDSTVVNGLPASGGVDTEVDATGTAGGPTTWLFETYQRGEFQPASPPWPQPSCGLPALATAAGHGVQFTTSACADGWAIAIGTRAGQRGQVVGLFNALRGNEWYVVELDSGASLGSDPGIYDIPLTLLRQLAAHFGPTFRPEIAIAPLIASAAMTGWPYVSGVITAGHALWFVAEQPAGSLADATLYRWSGSRWLPQGTVNRVPASLDYYMLAGNPDGITYGQFEAVTVSGTAEPGFVLQGSGSSHPDALTDAGGRWHAARYR